MSLFQPIRRATLLIPSGPAHDLNRNHLFIILTDPVANPESGGKDSVLLTSLSTLDVSLPHDPTCILCPGDHPFVTRNSFVSYRSSLVLESIKVVSGVDQGLFIAKPLMDSAIVDRICDGLPRSVQTPEKIKRFYRTYLRQLAGTP